MGKFGHISDEMKETVQKMKTVMGVIPSGCTKFLQPLDVSINKTFKAAFRARYDEWFRNGEFEYSRGGMKKPPNHVLQVQWVVEAWKQRDHQEIFRHVLDNDERSGQNSLSGRGSADRGSQGTLG